MDPNNKKDSFLKGATIGGFVFIVYLAVQYMLNKKENV